MLFQQLGCWRLAFSAEFIRMKAFCASCKCGLVHSRWIFNLKLERKNGCSNLGLFPFIASDHTGFLFHARDLEEIALEIHTIQLDTVLALLLMQSFVLLSSHLWIYTGFC